SQKPNMFFGDGLTFSAKGKVLNEPMIMHIDTGNADYADLGSQFYINNTEFVETHGKLESVGMAGAGGVHKSEVYLVSDIPVELGGNTVVPAEIIVAKEDLSDISALRFDCNIGLKTLMMFGKVHFNLIDFILSTEPRDRQNTLPENVQRKRNASIILSEFVKLENNQYRLELSKDEAEKLGVSPELYDEIVEDISNTNSWILKSLEKGDSIEIPDIQSIAKEYKNWI
ncbi:MAG: hypothetical protein J1E84_07765, partial [Muribaculaceae bacterium]|nr:hypothetical protein [Muribaculaceae bacterium]